LENQKLRRERAPTSETEREEVLDVVRGCALFGVLTVNAVTAFRISVFEQFLPYLLLPESAQEHVARASEIDRLIGRLVTIGFESKAFALFSLLFGMGIAAQASRLVKQRSQPVGRMMARRIGFLLVLGVAHFVLIWNGDILTFYALLAIVGVPLILGLRQRPRVLLALVIGLLVLPAVVSWPPIFPLTIDMQDHIDAARHIYPVGSFAQVLAFRITELRPIGVLLYWSAPRTLALFLLGAVVWELRLFRSKYVAHFAVSATLLGALGMWLTYADAALTNLVIRRLHDHIERYGSILLALGYGATITFAYQRSALVQRLLRAWIAPLGRMALTSYLTQSIVLGFLFYGYGLGRFGSLGEAHTMMIVCAIYVTQAILANAWLRRYRFGPIEWIWRSITYARVVDLRRSSQSQSQ
jgi:uncharacterized protein